MTVSLLQEHIITVTSGTEYLIQPGTWQILPSNNATVMVAVKNTESQGFVNVIHNLQQSRFVQVDRDQEIRLTFSAGNVTLKKTAQNVPIFPLYNPAGTYRVHTASFTIASSGQVASVIVPFTSRLRLGVRGASVSITSTVANLSTVDNSIVSGTGVTLVSPLTTHVTTMLNSAGQATFPASSQEILSEVIAQGTILNFTAGGSNASVDLEFVG